MISDLTLLALFLSDRRVWDEYHGLVKQRALTKEAQVILSDLEEFYTRGAGETPEQFATWFHQVQHPEFSENQHNLYNIIFQRVSEQVVEQSDAFVGTVLSHFKVQDLKGKLQKQLEAAMIDPIELEVLINQLKDVSEKEELIPYDDPSWEAMCRATVRTEGLIWPLKCLQKSIGPLIKGDFGVVAAAVETGKTAFMAMLAGFMGQQLEEGDVLYFNNEGENMKVRKRMVSGVIGIPDREIDIENLEQRDKYIEMMHGDLARVKFFSCDSWKPNKIRKVCKQYNPKLIIVDMIDKLETDRKVEGPDYMRLASLYKSMRAIAVEFAPVIGTSQCDASVVGKTAEGEPWFQHYIMMHQLTGSKIHKQGEMEFMITIGKDDKYPSTRYIHVPKNKLGGDGDEASRYIKSEVRFDVTLSKYSD